MWDNRLIARKNLDDTQYVASLNGVIKQKGLAAQPAGNPVQWAEQSFRLAKEGLVANDTNIDDGYFRRHITVIDERLAQGGLRLAAELNRLLAIPPPAR